MLVASSLPKAPSTKASRGRTRLRFSSAFFSCSKMVYCRMGFMTSTRAGSTPAKRAVGPSSLKRERSVPMVDGFEEALLEPPGSCCEEEVSDLAVMRVLTTQMGLVISTVALPARAPASMDSTVVSLEEARPALMAARSKAARVHSYPGGS